MKVSQLVRLRLTRYPSPLQADVAQKGESERPDWMKKMAARRRKTLVVCLECHHKIQYGRYDSKALSR